MRFEVIGSSSAITAAINEFKAAYHEDYFSVRAEAEKYLKENTPSTAATSRFAIVLIQALRNWGAGKRSAPSCQALDVATRRLGEASLQEKLKKLASTFKHLSFEHARDLKCQSPFETIEDLDVCLIDALHELAAALLVGNTNVTYPMKALLLTTGLMPAFDSQVRGGLHVAGLSGFARTRYLIPAYGTADARRICALPFYVAECISRSHALLDDAIENSKYPELKGEYGRLFDILFFVQGRRSPEAALVGFVSTRSRPWYEI